MDIILVGLYLLSCLLKSVALMVNWRNVNEFSSFTRKVYSTGAVLERGRHFWIKKNRQTKVFNGCRFYQVNNPRIRRSNHKEYPVFQTKVIDFY